MDNDLNPPWRTIGLYVIPKQVVAEHFRIIENTHEWEGQTSRETLLIEALQLCMLLSGADLSDGYPNIQELPARAVEEVLALRESYEYDGRGPT